MRKIIRFRPLVPVTECKFVVTNGHQWKGIFRFKSDAERCLANLKDNTYWIQKGSR